MNDCWPQRGSIALIRGLARTALTPPRTPRMPRP
jgi:hypothetical protein